MNIGFVIEHRVCKAITQTSVENSLVCEEVKIGFVGQLLDNYNFYDLYRIGFVVENGFVVEHLVLYMNIGFVSEHRVCD